MTMQTDLQAFETMVREHLAVLFDTNVDLYYMAREWLKVIDHHSVRCLEAYEAGRDGIYLDSWTLWYARRRELLESMLFPATEEIEKDYPALEGATEALLVAFVRSTVEARQA